MTRATVWGAGAVGAATLAMVMFTIGTAYGVERLVWDAAHDTFVYAEAPAGGVVLVASTVVAAALVATSLVCAWTGITRAVRAHRQKPLRTA
ncbi:hypothetical protein [Microbacterium dauci]|uniref:Uncharacterized protein n=1 Tax=Microbacterium dauci TaxID=3048008 RepID=A0ABT6ZFF7_9MICO|nr:hypothetical protein [Microbacterium sp. LX3-4]MDJ1114893.1 hypothetical protein [Microbacterium sp. LX3-4]